MNGWQIVAPRPTLLSKEQGGQGCTPWSPDAGHVGSGSVFEIGAVGSKITCSKKEIGAHLHAIGEVF